MLYIFLVLQYHIKKHKYFFSQGLNHSRNCDLNLKYKKCGYLTYLNVDFCLKQNEKCPFNDSNAIFNISDLTRDIIIINNNNDIIFGNKTLKDFLINLYVDDNSEYYKVLDSTNLYNLTQDYNITNILEVANKNINDIKLELAELYISNEDIKLNKDNFKEEIKVKEYILSEFLFILTPSFIFPIFLINIA